MRIRFDEAEAGIPLNAAPFGSVVRTPRGETVYLVVSPMDGTGNRVLATLGGGIIKYRSQDERVVPLNAELIIFGPSAP